MNSADAWIADLLAGGPLDCAAQCFDVFTGAESPIAESPIAESAGEEPGGAGLVAALRARLSPPRYCGVCGRRMIVQVRPDGWWARCSRHGQVDSTSLDLR